MKIISGTAHRTLAKNIAETLGQPLADVQVDAFPDGETSVKINENVRGEDVFIIQPSCPPTNHNIMELLILVDAARRASAERITAVMPFFGYARQDRKDQPRVPITAKLVANLLTSAGVNRVLTMDLHAPQIQGFFAATLFQQDWTELHRACCSKGNRRGARPTQIHSSGAVGMRQLQACRVPIEKENAEIPASPAWRV